jgi:hypothetical protein
VDHAALIIELYTKAYSLFKEQEQAQDRTALYAAYRIAETYCANDQYDLAMRCALLSLIHQRRAIVHTAVDSMDANSVASLIGSRRPSRRTNGLR